MREERRSIFCVPRALPRLAPPAATGVRGAASGGQAARRRGAWSGRGAQQDWGRCGTAALQDRAADDSQRAPSQAQRFASC